MEIIEEVEETKDLCDVARPTKSVDLHHLAKVSSKVSSSLFYVKKTSHKRKNGVYYSKDKEAYFTWRAKSGRRYKGLAWKKVKAFTLYLYKERGKKIDLLAKALEISTKTVHEWVLDLYQGRPITHKGIRKKRGQYQNYEIERIRQAFDNLLKWKKASWTYPITIDFYKIANFESPPPRPPKPKKWIIEVKNKGESTNIDPPNKPLTNQIRQITPPKTPKIPKTS